mmetsp:Transcript_95452/g.307703  ORF Transcript_95452/g.307703 Transcript_95452/m.307703 type:complete len:212 (+) Transcript_95452:297-932(+)
MCESVSGAVCLSSQSAHPWFAAGKGAAASAASVDEIQGLLERVQRLVLWKMPLSDGLLVFRLLRRELLPLWVALARLQRVVMSAVNIKGCISKHEYDDSSRAGAAVSDVALCPACALKVQSEWVQEAKHIDLIWDLSNKEAFLQDHLDMMTAHVGLCGGRSGVGVQGASVWRKAAYILDFGAGRLARRYLDVLARPRFRSRSARHRAPRIF